MKYFALLSLLALASCATGYQPQSFTGGFSDYLTAPDEAVIMFHGNGYTSAERVIEMAALRCADVTLQHGYRYFVGVSMADLSTNASFTTPGYANTYGIGHSDRHRYGRPIDVEPLRRRDDGGSVLLWRSSRIRKR